VGEASDASGMGLSLIWVGLMALFRGISEIVLEFQVRRLHATAT